MPSRRRLATLLATAAALALAAPAGAQAADCAGADLVPAAGNLDQVSQATLCLLNNERAAQGLRSLVEAPGLTQPSLAYSSRMVAESFFAHVAPDGSSLVDRLTAADYIEPDGDWTVGENIAWGQGDLSTARNIVVAWMNSPGHRHNILTPEYTEIGIGVVPGTPGDASWGATYTTPRRAAPRPRRAGSPPCAPAARGPRPPGRAPRPSASPPAGASWRGAAPRGRQASGFRPLPARPCPML